MGNTVLRPTEEYDANWKPSRGHDPGYPAVVEGDYYEDCDEDLQTFTSEVSHTGAGGISNHQTKLGTDFQNRFLMKPQIMNKPMPSGKKQDFHFLIQSNQKNAKSSKNKTPGLTSGALSGQGGLIPGKGRVEAPIETNQPLKISSKNYIPIWNFFATEQESKQYQGNYYQEIYGQQTPTPDQYYNPMKNNENKSNNYPKKTIQVFVESNIEFTIDISDPKSTCGWLQSEIVRKYYEVLENQVYEQQKQLKSTKENDNNNGNNNNQESTKNLKNIHDFRRNTREQRMSTINQHVKLKKKFIVALKTLDMRESLDYWLTQYNRPLHVLENGEFLRAHFAKLTFTQNASSNFKVTRHDFEQIKVIGRGAFSRVILVRKKDTGRLYAMKIMRKDKLSREQKIKPIINERMIMEKLNHPFIIKLYWSFQSKTELFFVMDLCTGGEMFFHLGKVQKFTEDQAKFYFAELLLGIQHLHDMDIVYRDIKPENILIDIDGHVKIADFGLSKIIPKRQRSHSFCGSPEYMCPEILLGQGHDRRADIYCIGALLYELVVGFPPHFNQDHNQIYKGIVNNEPEYTEHNLSGVLENLLKRLLEKDPNHRFQSIRDVMKHAWLKDIDWEKVNNKGYNPPIVPGPAQCCIDEEFLNLPLDFEDSSVPLPTERRQSCYYESTIMMQSMISDKNTLKNSYLQSLYNNLNDTKNFSLLGNKEDEIPDPNTAPSSRQPQDQQTDKNEGNIVIEGLENFSFIDLPQEEIELREHFNKFIEQMRQNEIQLQHKKRLQEQEDLYGKTWNEPADSMNVTQSAAFDNMNEHNDCEYSHRHKNVQLLQNQNFSKTKTQFNKFGDKINFYPEDDIDELEQFEMIEQQLKEKHEPPNKKLSQLEVNSSMSTAGEGQKTQRGHLLQMQYEKEQLMRSKMMPQALEEFYTPSKKESYISETNFTASKMKNQHTNSSIRMNSKPPSKIQLAQKKFSSTQHDLLRGPPQSAHKSGMPLGPSKTIQKTNFPDNSTNNSMIGGRNDQRALPVPSSPQNFTMDKKSSMMTKPPQPNTKPYQISASKQPKPLGGFHSGSAFKLPGTQMSVPSLHTTKNRNLSSNKLQFGQKMKK